MYSHASVEKDKLFFTPDLTRHFDDLVRHFHVPATGGWRFSIADNGGVGDGTYDLYAHAFVIFALAHYYRATKDARAHDLALKTAAFIDTRFRIPGLPGFAEALDENLAPLPNIRRHETHMHLLEAGMIAAATWEDNVFRRLGEELAALFSSHFYDAEKNILPEYFTPDLKPHPEKGHIVEPGHYYEWVWLLKKHALQSGDPDRYDMACHVMLNWANEHGWDEKHGGIYDELSASGGVVCDSKRIWPFTEGLKAHALMLDARDPVKQERKDRIALMVDVFKSKYIDKRGFWVESLSRDLTPATDTMPASTPYHVYFGIMETRDILRARGKSKYPLMRLHNAIYRFRRVLSRAVQASRRRVVRGILKTSISSVPE